MTFAARYFAGAALIWAGVAIGGSLIATPAKFLAPSLSLPTALEVGRAQFFWVGVGEWMLCVGLTTLLLASGRRRRWIALAPIALFLVQRLWLMPILDARTVQVIAGERVGESALHLVYVCVEVAKVIALLWAGLAGERRVGSAGDAVSQHAPAGV